MSNNEEVRHAAVKALHDIMQSVPCSSLYSLAEAVLDAGYAAPVVERQEPIGYVDFWDLDRMAKGSAHWATLWDSDGSNNPSRGGDSVALYAEQPAPVAVVLPDLDSAFEAWWESDGQYCRSGGGSYEKTFAYRAYEAAIDKVKELNQ